MEEIEFTMRRLVLSEYRLVYYGLVIVVVLYYSTSLSLTLSYSRSIKLFFSSFFSLLVFFFATTTTSVVVWLVGKIAERCHASEKNMCSRSGDGGDGG